MWAEPRLEEILELEDPGVWGPEDEVGGINVLRSTNFSNDGRLDLTKLALRAIPQKKRDQKRLQPGDIVLERSGGSPRQPVGRVCYFDGDDRPHSFGNFCQRLRPNAAIVEPRFLFWYLHRFHTAGGTLAFQKQTTGIRNLEYRSYLQQVVPLPPLSEQRRIVVILDQADHLSRLHAEANTKADRILPALFRKMFGDPAQWSRRTDTRPLGELIQPPIGGATPSKSNSAYWNGEIPWVSPKAMKEDVISSTERRVTITALENSPLRLVPEGAVMIVVRGMILAHSVPVALAGREVVLNQDMKALLPKPPLSGEFLFGALRTAKSQLLAQVRTAAHGTRKLDTNDLLEIRIPDPDDAQVKAATAAHRELRRQAALRTKATADADLATELIRSRAFSGDLTAGWREVHRDRLREERVAQVVALRESGWEGC